ncbi:tetratricopeptide repeat protein [Chryseobacterium oryctis]|uniref:Tetratricopeptide repeat protein n=1 Tax=Chryseobacterium oryctis TaxID=2952618 RepID=A0ABT3HRM1_9FLAO|nr:tetratricopeptide repeat protein [Chryseobacterium oryctis]MCW3162435.1 tetratricopeptide repeat protein [Chryseobacterium oryctis]
MLSSVKMAQEALNQATECKSSLGVTKGNIYIAKALIEVGKFNDAFSYLKEIEKESLFKKDKIIQSEYHRLRGLIFSQTNLYDKAREEFRKQIKLSEKLDEQSKRLSSFWAHQNLAQIFIEQMEYDSAMVHLKIQEKILEEFDEKADLYNFTTTYAQIGEVYIFQNELTKGEEYLKKSLDLLNKNKSNYLFFTLKRYGDLNARKGNEGLAIKYYEDALQNAKDLGYDNAEREQYSVLVDYLKNFPSKQNLYTKYYNESKKVSKKVDNERQQLTSNIISYLNNTEISKSKDKIDYYRTIIISLSILIVIAAIAVFLKIKNQKKKTTQYLSQLKDDREELISTLNENKFEQLIQLVRANSPEFLILFKELYPDFISNLKKLNPNIKVSELSFCAMIFLNYSTKDIAEYTFVSIRAVQIRKNRLRKKYNIPSEVDLNVWMRSLDTKE